jgi:hypothetical protein
MIMDFSKWPPDILHEMEYVVFSRLENKIFPGIHVFRTDLFSLLMYLSLLLSSATVKMENEENTESACYATNDDNPL